MKCPSCGFDNIGGEDGCGQCLHSLMQLDIPHYQKDGTPTLLGRPVSDLLTGRDLLVCRPTDSVQKIIKIFQNEKKGCVLVYEKKRLVGILSNRDLLFRAVGHRKDLSQVTVEQVMTRNPDYVKPDDPIAFAVNKMAMGGYRHVPVIREDGTPVSILLIRDILRHISQQQKN